jgi:hypothetical protein
MHLKNLLLSASVAIFAILLFLLSLWRPERQVTLHQQHLLAACSDRNWTKAADFFAATYKDRWGHDKEGALHDARIALAQFFTLQISGLAPQLNLRGTSATVTEKIVLSGQGDEFAQEATRRVNQLGSPFVFTWQRQSWKPWDWKLVRTDNAALEIGSLEDF